MADMEHIFAWTEVDPEGGEGVIAAAIPMLGNMLGPLQHRDRRIAEMLRPVALAHQQKTGHIVRLVQFDRAVTVERHPVKMSNGEAGE